MITITVPTFDEFNKYQFIGNVEIKIKNKPDFRDVNKIWRILCGIPQGGVGREPLKDLLTDGKKEVTTFYDARQNSKKFKGYFVTVKQTN
jgi:hypothetical protein